MNTNMGYTVYVLSQENHKLYFCGRGDGQSYVLKDSLLGAVLWPSEAHAQRFIQAMQLPYPAFVEKQDLSSPRVHHKTSS